MTICVFALSRNASTAKCRSPRRRISLHSAWNGADGTSSRAGKKRRRNSTRDPSAAFSLSIIALISALSIRQPLQQHRPDLRLERE